MVPSETCGEQRNVLTPRIGCDLADTNDVADSILHFGDHYLDRVYTRTERRQTGDAPERLAARFAAKEAVLKLLRTTEGITYRDIEVVNDSDGVPQLRLSGRAEELAQQQHIDSVAISLSHERGFALATALALAGNPAT